ncbi:MAG: diaminopimelate epimerase [Flavobacteriaceae bacterium]
MSLAFVKYHGTGNDFIMIDDRVQNFEHRYAHRIASLCDRHTGIGADGLILLQNSDDYDFKMVYYNSDGALGSMCGNGARCIVHWAKELGIIKEKTDFVAPDGLHQAWFDKDEVVLAMADVRAIEANAYGIFLDTGSPHQVCIEKRLEGLDVTGKGRTLRYDVFGKEGANINFVAPAKDGGFALRTYERGVEAETLSCGTGATAAALAMHHLSLSSGPIVVLKTLGGNLKVSFDFSDGLYSNITLTGSATAVFNGLWL